jgi:hypothetical protein
MADSTVSTLFHATPARNLRSIFRTGLQPALATGKLKAVWLHEKGMRRWAVAHVADRHSTPVRQLAVIEVRIPRADLRRNRSGVWTCARVIRPDEIHGVNGLRIALASAR